MKTIKQLFTACLFLTAFVSYSQGTGPSITVNNTLLNCQIEVTFYQMNTTTMDCGALISTSFGLGVMSTQTVSPMPGHAFVRAFVQKGGGTPSCFMAWVEPNDSPCDTISINEGEYFSQCCSSSLAGGTHVKWSGGMGGPVIEVGNS